MKRDLGHLSLVWIALASFVGVPVVATDLLVVTFLTVQDCGLGVNTFRSEHHGDLFDISEAHRNMEWQIDGVLGECHGLPPSLVDPYSYLAIHCESSGFVATTQSLICAHQKDKYCGADPRMRARTESFVGPSWAPVRTRAHTTLCEECRTDVIFPDYAETPPEPPTDAP